MKVEIHNMQSRNNYHKLTVHKIPRHVHGDNWLNTKSQVDYPMLLNVP